MICLIVGDFGVGKDTVADFLMDMFSEKGNSIKAQKILSYSTRNPRFDGEDTHIFCTKEEFEGFNDIIAQTKIGGNYYGARASQFDKDKINLYCVDEKGVNDIVNANIDDWVVIEVVRPKWLIDLPEDRLNRKRDENFEGLITGIDFRIMNDGDIEKLKILTLECYNFLLREMKKSL